MAYFELKENATKGYFFQRFAFGRSSCGKLLDRYYAGPIFHPQQLRMELDKRFGNSFLPCPR